MTVGTSNSCVSIRASIYIYIPTWLGKSTVVNRYYWRKTGDFSARRVVVRKLTYSRILSGFTFTPSCRTFPKRSLDGEIFVRVVTNEIETSHGSSCPVRFVKYTEATSFRSRVLQPFSPRPAYGFRWLVLRSRDFVGHGRGRTLRYVISNASSEKSARYHFPHIRATRPPAPSDEINRDDFFQTIIKRATFSSFFTFLKLNVRDGGGRTIMSPLQPPVDCLTSVSIVKNVI